MLPPDHACGDPCTDQCSIVNFAVDVGAAPRWPQGLLDCNGGRLQVAEAREPGRFSEEVLEIGIHGALGVRPNRAASTAGAVAILEGKRRTIGTGLREPADLPTLQVIATGPACRARPAAAFTRQACIGPDTGPVPLLLRCIPFKASCRSPTMVACSGASRASPREPTAAQAAGNLRCHSRKALRKSHARSGFGEHDDPAPGSPWSSIPHLRRSTRSWPSRGPKKRRHFGALFTSEESVPSVMR